jgi:hypothetical protein
LLVLTKQKLPHQQFHELQLLKGREVQTATTEQINLRKESNGTYEYRQFLAAVSSRKARKSHGNRDLAYFCLFVSSLSCGSFKKAHSTEHNPP